MPAQTINDLLAAAIKIPGSVNDKLAAYFGVNFVGNGTPQGVLDAPTGSVYQDVQSTPGAVYTKTAAGVSGWAASGGSGAAKYAAETIMGVGDSITAHAQDPAIQGGTIQTGRSFLMWAQILSGGKLRYTGFSALGGQTTAQVLARDVPNVIAATIKPDYCTVFTGYNDIYAGGSATPVYANLTAIVDGLLGAGITPVLCTLPGYNTGLANLALMERVNTFVRRLAQQKRLPLADFQLVCSNPDTDPTVSTTQGTWTTGMLASAATDALHASTLGHKTMGSHLAAVLAPHTANVIDLPQYNNDSLNKVANGNMLIDAGADGIPDGWTTALAGTGVTTTIVADAAIPGSWWKIVKTVNDQTQYTQNYSGVTAGQILRLSFRLKINSITSTGNFQVHLYDTTNVHLNDPNVIPRSSQQVSAGQATTLQAAVYVDIGGSDGGAVTGEGPMCFEGVAVSTSGSIRITAVGPSDVQIAQMRLQVFNADGTPV